MSNSVYHQLSKPTPVPEDLAGLRQFVGWKYGEIQKNGKPSKPPINPRTGRPAKSDNPATWGTYEEAIRCADKLDLDGIGIVPTRSDDLVGIDIDGCIAPETGEIEPWALNVIEKIASYTEFSPSGTGIRIFALGELPGKNERRGGVRRGRIEMYDQGQYLTLTGNVYSAYKPVRRRQKALERLYAWISHKSPQRAPQGRREAVKVPVGDAELVEKMRRAKNGPKFCKLYDQGDASGYDSESHADQALMGMLAFWTGLDGERMERMFTASALGRRGKWSQRPDYRRSTVEKAINGCTSVYEGKPPNPKADAQNLDGEVQQILAELRACVLADTWTGRSGPGEWAVYHAVLNTVGRFGRPHKEGVAVSAASRDLALKCGKHRQTVEKLLGKLEERGYIRRIRKGRGETASEYLLPRCCHNQQGKLDNKKTSSTSPHRVYLYGNSSAATLTMLLARVGNPAPQTDKAYDKNGRKLTQESKYLYRPIGDLNALLIEKVAAWPGMDLPGIARAMGRPPSKVQRNLDFVVEGGFIFETDGRYYAPEDLIDRLLDHLEDAGCNYRERNLRSRYKEDRKGYEEHRRGRLDAVARECGVEGLRQEESIAEPERVQSLQPEPEDASVITDAGDPAQFKALAAMMREYIAQGREQESPIPDSASSNRVVWPHDPAKAELYREARERWAEKCRTHELEKARAGVVVAV